MHGLLKRSINARSTFIMGFDKLTVVLTVLALLVLVGGSIRVGLGILGFGAGPNYNEAMFAIMLFAWPFTLVVAAIFGSIAMARVQGFAAALALLVGGTVAGYVFVWFALGLIYQITGGNLRSPGLPTVLVPLVFLAVNVAAVYVAWSHILHKG
jgi:hypothetical protein